MKQNTPQNVWRVMVEVKSRGQAHQLADALIEELIRHGNRYDDNIDNTSVMVIDVERTE